MKRKKVKHFVEKFKGDYFQYAVRFYTIGAKLTIAYFMDKKDAELFCDMKNRGK